MSLHVWTASMLQPSVLIVGYMLLTQPYTPSPHKVVCRAIASGYYTGPTATMAEDVERLESLHSQLRNVRALLPELMRKLAFVGDDSSSLQLFQAVASILAQWQEASDELEQQYESLRPVMDELNHAQLSDSSKASKDAEFKPDLSSVLAPALDDGGDFDTEFFNPN